MELQIQDLVSSIKKDGIESANREAAQILADAKAQAEKIVADARNEADKLRGDAQAEIGVFKASAQLSAEQAKRDAVLAFRQEIGAELNVVSFERFERGEGIEKRKDNFAEEIAAQMAAKK